MPITWQLDDGAPAQKIYATRYAPSDRQRVVEELARLSQTGSVTQRDVRLLETLREFSVLSLDQLSRLFWPGRKSARATAWNRLRKLLKYNLTGYVYVAEAALRTWGLETGFVYALGLGGWIWLREEIRPALISRHLEPDLVIHDLRVAELYVRWVESAARRGPNWQVTWAGERALSGLFGPDPQKKELGPAGLVVLLQQREGSVAALPMFIELDPAGPEQRCRDYAHLAAGDWRSQPHLTNLGTFPVVAMITSSEQRLQALYSTLQQHRGEGIAYYLASWPALVRGGSDDILSAPVWLKLTADGHAAGIEPEQRLPLLPPPASG